ncbi:C4-dicarboxylate ABC transporter [Iodidimonas gelatinilytica]|uniref:C4-dicarboxylate ABC transporter n=1 Tax=Iodidimonas gelatinilytica TaxID=1236966 RepID=A0A5A7N309_9PROT|nr:TRAP transporter large permease subunit [Iodidimonas gelatinilytica]GEQ98346.1 C4-dicarboxylate ABC transporter [Iodidimonas gelatinilytica]GER02075.1 C4-dicarboxylate ABC transporter [Iodidimonas gelatinilytica]
MSSAGTALVGFMFLALLGFLLTGFPVAFVLGGVALVFAVIGLVFGLLEPGFILLMPDRIYGLIQNELLLAVPLFIAMGVMLEKSRVAEDLLDSMGRLFGPLRGGLGFSVMIVGALLAASTGIVGATVVTMGMMSLPVMLKRGYDPALATGSIAAAGTLGQIIPPSIVLILLGDVLSSAYQEAQRDMGITAPDAVSVGELFAGALLPGLGLVGLYLLYLIVQAIFRPKSSPAMPPADGELFNRQMVGRLLGALLPPVLLIIAVLGSILGGIATPTEAASLGAVGAIFLGAARLGSGRNWPLISAIAALILVLGQSALIGPATQGMPLIFAFGLCAIAGFGLFLALWRLWKAKILAPVMRSTVRVTVMIYTILVGAALFSLVFRGLGGDHSIEAALANLPGGTTGALITVMLVMFVLGFFLDFIEITFVVVPIVAPVLFVMGVDPVWLGVMMAMNLQTSFLTPPFGFALFYLRGVAPDSVKTGEIYRGALPFVAIQIIGLLLLALIPELATWLPAMLYNN